MNARAKKIRAACDGTTWSPPQSQLLDAFACMIEAATARVPPKAVAAEVAKLAVAPAAVFEAIKATHKVLCDPIDKRWFGRLGVLLRSVPVDAAMLECLCSWLTAGGLAWWTVPLTFDHVFMNLSKWLASAREWDDRGRQPLGTKGGVGIEIEQDVDSWASFKAR